LPAARGGTCAGAPGVCVLVRQGARCTAGVREASKCHLPSVQRGAMWVEFHNVTFITCVIGRARERKNDRESARAGERQRDSERNREAQDGGTSVWVLAAALAVLLDPNTCTCGHVGRGHHFPPAHHLVTKGVDAAGVFIPSRYGLPPPFWRHL
jgi:hypothetical protein